MNKKEGDLRYKIEVSYWDVFNKYHTYKSEGHFVPLLKMFVNTSSDSD